MSFGETLFFYLLIGGAVAAGRTLLPTAKRSDSGWWSAIACCVFWPLFLPMLFAEASPIKEPAKQAANAPDELSECIEQVERELDAALSSLGGWAGDVVERRADRLQELRAALVHQAERIRDMESLLTREQTHTPHVPSESETSAESDERSRRSLQARQENMARLAGVCRQARSDLLATLAWIRELVSRIHLAKFTGASAARAEELVGQIAAAVEGIASLSNAPHEFAEPASHA